MNVILDECLPKRLGQQLMNHEVTGCRYRALGSHEWETFEGDSGQVRRLHYNRCKYRIFSLCLAKSDS